MSQTDPMTAAFREPVPATTLHALLREARPTLALAGPIVLGQVGIMLMGVVDTAMVGTIGPGAVGAVGVGTSLFSAAYVTGFGLLLGIDRLAGVAFGAGRVDECRRTLTHGAYIAIAGAAVLTAILYLFADHLAALGITPALVPDAARYLRVLAWTLLPSLLFGVLRQTLQAMGRAHAPTVVLLLANLVNAGGNQLFIHGVGSFHGLGVVGSAWATMTARTFMCVALGVYAWRQGLVGRVSRPRVHAAAIGDLLRLGIPASMQVLLEVGVFATATVLVAGMGVVPAAAHQAVLVIASFTFMVPLGTGSAGAVRVAQAAGRGDVAGAIRAGWSAVSLGVSFMALSGLVLLLAPVPILHLFLHDAATVALARRLLFCAAVFQIFDGAQVTLSGVLRGAGDTVRPMLANLAGHWLIGLPVALLFAFHFALGAVGIWIGLASGLASVAMVLLVFWRRRIAQVVRDAGSAPGVPAIRERAEMVSPG